MTLDDPMSMTLQQQMLVAHYNQYWGLATSVQRYAFSEQPYDAPFVAEFFIGSEAEPLTVYATLGMSDLPMPDAPNDLRLELFMYANEPLDGLAEALALLAIYPFNHHHALAPLDTIYGSRPLVPGSTLTAVLLALPTREPEEFAIVDTGDLSIQLLMAVPITEAERRICVEHDALTLLGLLAEQRADLADFHRPSVVEGGDRLDR